MAKRGYISPKERGLVFALDLCHCRYCGKWQTPWSNPTPHIDHVVALSNGGDDDITNFTLSCQECNLSKYTKNWQAKPRGIFNYVAAGLYLMVTAVLSNRRN